MASKRVGEICGSKGPTPTSVWPHPMNSAVVSSHFVGMPPPMEPIMRMPPPPGIYPYPMYPLGPHYGPRYVPPMQYFPGRMLPCLPPHPLVPHRPGTSNVALVKTMSATEPVVPGLAKVSPAAIIGKSKPDSITLASNTGVSKTAPSVNSEPVSTTAATQSIISSATPVIQSKSSKKITISRSNLVSLAENIRTTSDERQKKIMVNSECIPATCPSSDKKADATNLLKTITVGNVPCPLCGVYCGQKNRKQHAAVKHLPWYFALKFHKDEQVKKSKFAKQFLPVLGDYFVKKIKHPPLELFCNLLGKLLHGFLEMLSDALAIKQTEDLVELVKTLKLYPHKATEILDDEKLLIRAHRNFIGDKTAAISISPPNCLSAVLHWTTIVNIINRLPPTTLNTVQTFEKYTARNIIDKKLETGNTSDIVSRMANFQKMIRQRNPFSLWQLLDEYPKAAVTHLQGANGMTPVGYAIKMGCYESATILFMYGAQADQPDHSGWTPIRTEAKHGHLSSVQFLITWEASTQIQHAYDEASSQGHKSVCKLLVREFPNLKLELQATQPLKPSVQRPVEPVHKNHAKKTIVFKRASSQGKVCPLCERGNADVDHVTKHHFPWYAGLQHSSASENVSSRSELCLRILKGMYLSKNKRLPYSILTILGKLLHDMLVFIATNLELTSLDELLKFTLEHNLWSEVSPDTITWFSRCTIPALQLYIEKEENVLYSPPNCISALLHWETLFNLITRLPKTKQNTLLTLETFVWSKDNPTLPSLNGPIAQPPTQLKSAIHVPTPIRTQFMKHIDDGNVEEVSRALKAHPGLVYHQSPPSMSGIVANATVFSPMKSVADRALILKVLMLAGAPIDAVDKTGKTALHHAVGRADLFATSSLLLWGADMDIKAVGNQTPHDMARSHTLCLPLFEMARVHALEELTNLASYETCKVPDDAEKGENLTTKESGNDCKEPYTEDLCREVGDRPCDGRVEVAPSRELSSASKEKPPTTATNKHADNSSTNTTTTKKCTEWRCPICQTTSITGRQHSLEAHLPWYISLGKQFQHLIYGQRKTKLASKVASSMIASQSQSGRVKRALHSADPRVSCFVRLLGQLQEGLLKYITTHLGLSQSTELLNYAKANYMWSDKETLHSVDTLCIKAFQTYTNEESDIQIGPPNHVSALLHWNTLVNLISKLPKVYQDDILTLENYEICKTDCVRIVGTEKGPKVHMSLPSMDSVPYEQKETYMKAMSMSDLATVSYILNEWPVLAYYPIPMHNEACPVWFCLANYQYHVPAVLYLHGASPDQLDATGSAPIHNAVKKGDFKAVQFLLLLEADIGLLNNQGKTAFDIAREKKLQKITAYLEEEMLLRRNAVEQKCLMVKNIVSAGQVIDETEENGSNDNVDRPVLSRSGSLVDLTETDTTCGTETIATPSTSSFDFYKTVTFMESPKILQSSEEGRVSSKVSPGKAAMNEDFKLNDSIQTVEGDEDMSDMDLDCFIVLEDTEDCETTIKAQDKDDRLGSHTNNDTRMCDLTASVTEKDVKPKNETDDEDLSIMDLDSFLVLETISGSDDDCDETDCPI